MNIPLLLGLESLKQGAKVMSLYAGELVAVRLWFILILLIFLKLFPRLCLLILENNNSFGVALLLAGSRSMKLLSKLLMLLYFGVCRNVGLRVLIVVFLGAL